MKDSNYTKRFEAMAEYKRLVNLCWDSGYQKLLTDFRPGQQWSAKRIEKLNDSLKAAMAELDGK